MRPEDQPQTPVPRVSQLSPPTENQESKKRLRKRRVGNSGKQSRDRVTFWLLLRPFLRRSRTHSCWTAPN